MLRLSPPVSQNVGLPYMAHASHAEDTLFVVAEPNLVFLKEDGEKWLESLDEEEHMLYLPTLLRAG